MDRRHFIKASGVLAAGTFVLPGIQRPAAIATDKKSLGFDYARLKGQARALAGQAYVPPQKNLPPVLTNLDWDQYQSIRFRHDQSAWAKDDVNFRLSFFHLGRGYREAVRIHEVHQGQAREIRYDPAQFDFRGSGVRTGDLPSNIGFAGFRVQFHSDWESDIVAFLGASYFRAVGGDRQYGLSARGLAIDTGLDRPEEFPLFNTFWIERPQKNSDHLVVYALMDSPSIAGAYRFDIVPGATLVMKVDAALYPRKPIERLGIAPLTSMFQCGENDRRMANDWRPEIHDSDGLALLTGDNERIWRPLTNPRGLRVNSYLTENPRGFGLLQRDRRFDHYQDDGVYYDRRPNVWTEPDNIDGHGWGKGAVQLVEIPTADETFDNIVSYWNPANEPQPGQELLYSYRLYWGSSMPTEATMAQVVATRTGIGGIVGQTRRYFSWRFAIDFAGGPLAGVGKHAKVEPVITVSRGRVEIVSARPLAAIDGYRAMFDLRLLDSSIEPVDLRLYLRLGGQALSETWAYQWTPPPPNERQY